MRHGGRILVDQLAIQGIRQVFQLPGESFLPVLDGLRDRPEITTVTGRQEGGVTMMAEAAAKLTGRPGIAFVTRGPGATNASAGVHVARQDETPLILFVGQVERSVRDREGFQEVEYRQMFAPLAKWVAEIPEPSRIPEYVARAFHVSRAGRPGPVVLALPQDVLAEKVEVADAGRAERARNEAGADGIAAVLRLLSRCRRPFMIVGGGSWNDRCRQLAPHFAESWRLPVGTAFRCQDFFDNLHPCYAGDVGIGIRPGLAQAIRESDLLLLIGSRPDEITAGGYDLLAVPEPSPEVVHVYPDPREIGWNHRPGLAIVAEPETFLSALRGHEPPNPPPWRERTAELHASWQEWSGRPEAGAGSLRLETVVRHLDQRLPDDAILTSGAGNYAGWAHRYFRFHGRRRQLAPRSGSMGYALPAAVAASIVEPGRCVVCLAGDGCFQMTMQEFGTACQHGANILVLVANNGMYGTIRMHQASSFPGRPFGTALDNPDFAALARSYGAFGMRVEHDRDVPEAVEEGLRFEGPALLDLRLDPEALTTRLRLSEHEQAALGSRAASAG